MPDAPRMLWRPSFYVALLVGALMWAAIIFAVIVATH